MFKALALTNTSNSGFENLFGCAVRVWNFHGVYDTKFYFFHFILFPYPSVPEAMSRFWLLLMQKFAGFLLVEALQFSVYFLIAFQLFI